MDIAVKNITKKYDLQRAVDDITFDVKTGEILGFLGPNGAGKTTTMKMITCFMAPTSGDISVGGLSIKENPDEIKKKIGYLPENNPLYQDMPVLDYLRFVAALQGLPNEIISERIREMVVICGIDSEKHKKINQLSKGFRQRVGLAQAMIHDPDILLLDEPTSGLDPNQIIEIRKLIKEVGKEKTVILSTHILPEVEATCDRILIINKGKIVADGTPDTLRKQAQGQEILKVKIEDGERNEIIQSLQEMENISVVDPVLENKDLLEIQSKAGSSSRKPIFNLCVEKGWTLTEMTPVETRLEDIFRDVTTE